MTAETAVQSYPNQLVEYDYTQNPFVILKLRYGHDPFRGWTTQKIFAIKREFYDSMRSIIDFNAALKESLRTRNGEELAKELAGNPNFYQTDFENEPGEASYFQLERSEHPSQWDLSHEVHYSEGLKHGLESEWDWDEFNNQVYLSSTIQYRKGQKHGCWNRYHRPNEKFQVITHGADHWMSLRLEREAIKPETLTYENYYDTTEETRRQLKAGNWERNDMTFVEDPSLSPKIGAPYLFMTLQMDECWGTHASWHENGQQASLGSYQDSDPVGEHYTYHWNGNVEQIIIYPDKPEKVHVNKDDPKSTRVYRKLYQANFDEDGEVVHAMSFDENNKQLFHCHFGEIIEPARYIAPEPFRIR